MFACVSALSTETIGSDKLSNIYGKGKRYSIAFSVIYIIIMLLFTQDYRYLEMWI